MNLPPPVIVVWFSCGAASAVAAKLTVDQYPWCRVRVVNNPVAEEHPDNRRFLLDVQDWIGVEIETAVNPKYPAASAIDVWNDRQAMSFPHGAPCTQELKKAARQHWENHNRHNCMVMGFTVEEVKRYRKFCRSERSNVLPVLIDAGLTKQGCIDTLLAAGIEPPEMYRLGYPNANCIGCVKATSPTYWNHVRQVHPDIFAERAKQSRRLGVRLVMVKNERIFLDELDPAARGRPMKSMDFECGIFCEEKGG